MLACGLATSGLRRGEAAQPCFFGRRGREGGGAGLRKRRVAQEVVAVLHGPHQFALVAGQVPKGREAMLLHQPGGLLIQVS